MPEEPGDEAESGWLLEPANPGEVHVSIEIGSEVELSPEARAALEAFMDSVAEAEVAGFMFDLGFKPRCPQETTCSPKGKCTPLTTDPNCAKYVRCRIAEIV